MATNVVENRAWLFVPDCRPQSGGGHVSRCMVLAQELSHFYPVHFFLHNDNGRWQQHLVSMGFNVAGDVKPGERFCGVLLDDYNFTARDIENWRRQTLNLAMIVDTDPAPGELDLIISPSLPANPETTNCGRVLRGFQYALVDPRYAQEDPIPVRHLAHNLLVFCGRWDPLNHTSVILDALLKLQASKIKFFAKIVLDSGSPYIRSIRDQIERLNGAAQLFLDAPDLVEETRTSDLAIASGGVTLLERCAAGLPSITLITADNQRVQTDYFGAAGATTVLDATKRINADQVTAILKRTMRDHSLRLGMQQAALQLVDGKGAVRVAKAMADLIDGAVST